jgi:hypothetical protein
VERLLAAQVIMTTPESASAEAFDQFLVGRLIAASNGWKNLLVWIGEAFQTDQGTTRLRDLSGFKDNFLAALLEGLHKELWSRYRSSSLFVDWRKPAVC